MTEARNRIASLKEQGESLSFNAWLIKCISQAVCEYKPIHGLRKGKRKVILFEDIDISVMIEREVNGAKVPLPCLVRETNKKSIAEISAEIASGKKQDIENEKDLVLGGDKSRFLMKTYYALPGFIRSFIWKQMIRRPFFFKKNMGTSNGYIRGNDRGDAWLDYPCFSSSTLLCCWIGRKKTLG